MSSDIHRRLWSAAIGIPALVLATWFEWSRIALVLVATGLCAYELATILNSIQVLSSMETQLIVSAVTQGCMLMWFDDPLIVVAVLGIFMMWQRIDYDRTPWTEMAVITSLSFPFACSLELSRTSFWTCIAGAWIGDAAALLVGRTWGSVKLWPVVSPKKTLEGLVAGTVASMAFFTWTHGRVDLALMCSVAAVLGDLAESWIKRIGGVVNSSDNAFVNELIPGHGGLLDRLDSVLPVFVMTWAMS